MAFVTKKILKNPQKLKKSSLAANQLTTPCATLPRDSIDQYCPDAGDVPENNWGVMVTALNQIPPCRGEPSSLKDKSRNSCKRQRKGILLNFSLFIFRLTVLFLTFESQ